MLYMTRSVQTDRQTDRQTDMHYTFMHTHAIYNLKCANAHTHADRQTDKHTHIKEKQQL